MEMLLHIPLAKIDEQRRMVFGRAVQEVPDKSGEIIDYDTAKPAFMAWSAETEKASNGLSKGNVREMHNPKTAVGRVVQIDFNDAERAIDVGVEVVDDNAWQKVCKGVYTGFSVGGAYEKRWPDQKTGLKKYTPKVRELSLVDSPCIPTARFVEVLKADGSTSQIELQGRVQTFEEILSGLMPRPTFEDHLAAELAKGAWRDQPREHNGAYSRKMGQHIGAGGGAAAGLALGGLAGFVAGPAITRVVGSKLGPAAGSVARRASEGLPFAGAALGGAALGTAGSRIGYEIDEAGRRRRARKAGRLEAYQNMKAKIDAPKKKAAKAEGAGELLGKSDLSEAEIEQRRKAARSKGKKGGDYIDGQYGRVKGGYGGDTSRLWGALNHVSGGPVGMVMGWKHQDRANKLRRELGGSPTETPSDLQGRTWRNVGLLTGGGIGGTLGGIAGSVAGGVAGAAISRGHPGSTRAAALLGQTVGGSVGAWTGAVQAHRRVRDSQLYTRDFAGKS